MVAIERTLRMMAWERAKGELQAMLHTFVDTRDKHEEEAYPKVDKLINKFVEDVEEYIA